MTKEEMGDEAVAEIPEKPERRSRRSRGHVTIFGTWCKGCGLCIEFCPQGVLVANGQGRPVIAYPEKCTACNWCESHCPDMAITVHRLGPEEMEELKDLTDLAERGALPGGDL